MSRNRRDERTGQTAGLLERLAIGPLQFVTDMFSGADESSSRSKPHRGESISLGYAPHPYNRKKTEELRIPYSTLRRHAYLLGGTGSGKTFTILVMILDLARGGEGFCVLDVHGDLSRMVLGHLAAKAKKKKDLRRMKNRLVLIEPFDPDYAPAFNPLQFTTRESAYQQAIEMLHIFKRIWKDVSWGSRMEELLRNLLLSLSMCDLTLADAQTFLTNHEFRHRFVANFPDRDLHAYWSGRFGTLSDKMKVVYTEPVLNKMSIFTSDPYVRHVICQRKSSFDFRTLMDQRKWVIINISKGALKQNAHLLGSLFVSKIKSAALSRVDIPESERVPFYLAVDEFQNFLGYNFEEILSEARKYCLSLILAHQNLAQIDKRIRESIFGNVGTLLFFRAGHSDLEEIAREFRRSDHELVKRAIAGLGVGEAVKHEQDGTYKKIRVHQVSNPHPNQMIVAQLRQNSRDAYCQKRVAIEKGLIKRTSAPNKARLYRGLFTGRL